jgi:hypothetical protein
MPPTANELSHYISTCQTEYSDECRSETYDYNVGEDIEDVQDTAADDYESPRPMAATLSDFLRAGNPWIKIKRKRRVTNDLRQNANPVCKEKTILGSGKRHRRGKGEAIFVTQEEATMSGDISRFSDKFSLSDAVCSTSTTRISENVTFDFQCFISNRQSIESLRSKWQNHFEESSSFPRIFLVDLTGSCTVSSNVSHLIRRRFGNRRRVYMIAKEFSNCGKIEELTYLR